ncbi:MAG TPA: PAS domain S-box protein, partial [Mycobacterium sp.]|nr:PAS domain S-box protein [Mycobacterium sp.]
MTVDRRPDGPAADEEARLLRRLVNNIPAIVSFWDRDQRNVIANQAFVNYFGITPAEMHGRHVREVLGEELYNLNLADIEAVLRGEQREFERAFQDRDGRTRYMQTAFVPEVVDGTVVGFYGFGSDLTARVEAEHARDDALRLLRISMDNAPIGQAIADMSLRAQYVNPAFCEMSGYSADELIGVNFRDFVHPEDVETAKAEFDALKNAPQSHLATELRVVGRDGSVRWVQRNAIVVPGAHGSDDVIIGQFQD